MSTPLSRQSELAQVLAEVRQIALDDYLTHLRTCFYCASKPFHLCHSGKVKRLTLGESKP